MSLCELCPTKFKRRNNVWRHYRMKHNIDPFSPDCGLASAKPDNPRCQFCNAYFNHQGFLTRHLERYRNNSAAENLPPKPDNSPPAEPTAPENLPSNPSS